MVGFNVVVIVETFVAFVIALVLHEFAHAGMAALLGDNSQASRDRLTLAPRRQMTAIGTIVAIVLSYHFVGMGWGRPLEADARKLRVGANLGLILVAIAGPLLNAVIGVGLAFGLHAVPQYTQLLFASQHCGNQGAGLQRCIDTLTGEPGAVLRVEQFLIIFAVTNIVIALLNVIPLHPLDGYHVLFALLPNRQAISYRNVAPYMELALLVIFFVLPVIFSFVGIGLNPADALGGVANAIAVNITGGAFTFYPAL